jgi:hypothetical protein
LKEAETAWHAGVREPSTRIMHIAAPLGAASWEGAGETGG